MAKHHPQGAYEAADKIDWLLSNKVKPANLYLNQGPKHEHADALVRGLFECVLEAHKAHLALEVPSPVEPIKDSIEHFLSKGGS